MQVGLVPVDLIPAQVDHFTGPEPMPVHGQQQRRIPEAPTVALGGLDQPFHLSFGQIFLGPNFPIGPASWSDFPLFALWWHQSQVRFCWHISLPTAFTFHTIRSLWNVAKNIRRNIESKMAVNLNLYCVRIVGR